MTVKELIKELQDYPKKATVVIYSTCDGNISVEGIDIAGHDLDTGEVDMVQVELGGLINSIEFDEE
jgi:hypothetical protein